MTDESDYACLGCSRPLTAMTMHSGALAWVCGECSGVLLSSAALRRGAAPQKFASIWGALQAESYTAARACPCCNKSFRTFAAPSIDIPVQLDGCPSCLVLWFDVGELEKFGVSAKFASADVATALIDLEQDFGQEEAELKATTNALWLIAYDLMLRLREALSGR